jgi:polyhydroxyalkanoate synthesis regulator phasin
MRATAGSAASTGGRAAELVDEVVRRSREARDELSRRGQEAGAEISRRGQEAGAGLVRRGQEATGEVGRRLELLERRLAELEGRLKPDPEVEPERTSKSGQEDPSPKPQAEG